MERGKLAVIVSVLVLALLGSIYCYEAFYAPSRGCTLEQRVCPDGSIPERNPDCSWAPCPGAQLANPASEYCVSLGGQIEIIGEEPDSGGQVGLCNLPGGTVCEEWTLFRGECPPYPASKNSGSPSSTSCSADSDCVPATDCHPTSCINKAYYKPSGRMCTEVCSGPLDCGAGWCGCVSGKCAIIPGLVADDNVRQ